MPIRADLRHHYRGPGWQATRELILARAQNKCEHCHRENGSSYVSCSGSDDKGGTVRKIEVQLGVAHLDHDPTNNVDSNLQALCRRCHLMHDKGKHKETRSIRKDGTRPLLEVANGKNAYAS